MSSRSSFRDSRICACFRLYLTRLNLNDKASAQSADAEALAAVHLEGACGWGLRRASTPKSLPNQAHCHNRWSSCQG
eukprot:scaffold123287_cov30-Tisochrysis_lutea.AAC.5